MTDVVQSPAREVCEGIWLCPVVHSRVDMAAVVRGLLRELEPDILAVELPTTFENHVKMAVRRLPALSLVISEDDKNLPLVWTVAPGDPFAEGIRWAMEEERTVRFIDPDIAYAERHLDRVPDPYAIWSMGARAYLDAVVEHCDLQPYSEADSTREQGMAFHIQDAQNRASLKGHKAKVLVLVGAAHTKRLAKYLQGPTAQPLARVRRTQMDVRNIHPDSMTALMTDSPLAHATFERLRSEMPEEAPELQQVLPRKISLTGNHLGLVSIEGGGTREGSAESRVDFAAFWARRSRDGTEGVDRFRLGRVIWRIASASYLEQTETEVQRWQKDLFFDFARRQARVSGQLVPGLLEWVASGRGVGDDNLAWEVFSAAKNYPWQKEKAEIPTVSIDGDELDLGTRKIRFRRRFFKTKQRLVRVPIRDRPETDDPNEWLQGFDSGNIMSYPPEDIVLEDYGHYLQKKAVSVLASERSKVEPFSTSMLDGIDIRETMRNVHERRLYVREMGRVQGDAGSVVVIFDRDVDNSRFPYTMTWLGEHSQESDMAFYASQPEQQIVGPGIMRATYGAFMLTWPPRRLYDVWQDPDYQSAREKGDLLTMAAIDYSLDRIIVHVAADPPADYLRQYANTQRKKLVHLPIGGLSPVALKRLRVVHLLAGSDKRDIARDYIW
jgi:hypothetical protein